MLQFFRTNEYKVMIYRLFLAYLFYFIGRVLFFAYNASVLDVASTLEFFKLCFYGLTFDTTAIFLPQWFIRCVVDATFMD